MVKRILFVCVENSCRSQMAEGFANHHGRGDILASSAGTTPAEKVDESAIDVMKEKDIDISHNKPKKIPKRQIPMKDNLF